jgi:hypothetical protein
VWNSVRSFFLCVSTVFDFIFLIFRNTSDPQINVDYLTPYNYDSLKIRWYSALGVKIIFLFVPFSLIFAFSFFKNHEYGYNVTAEIDYTKQSSTWFMPGRYYTSRINLGGGNYATLLFLDTSPCVQDYRSSDPTNWDPCMTQYPTCSQYDTDDDFEGPCLFHSNIISQDCSAQYNWLKTTLQGIPTSDWLFVVGHHPLDEVDVKDFITPLQQRGFSLYLNGHSHLLNQYTIDGTGAYMTTGAGAMVNTMDQQHPITAAKVAGKNITEELLKEMGRTFTGHTSSLVWQDIVAGFSSHSFNSDFTQLTTSFITYQGTVVHTFTVNKAGKIVG